MRKSISCILLVLLVLDVSLFAFNLREAKAIGTIYIRADGSIDPPTASISTADNTTYFLTGEISEVVMIERDNIVFDGAGHTIQTGGGITASSYDRSNVTIRNTKFVGSGILLSGSNHRVVGNCLETPPPRAISLQYASHCVVSNNSVESCPERSIWIYQSSYNNISGNSVFRSYGGIMLYLLCSGNIVSGNSIVDNEWGFEETESQSNIVSGNFFVNNTYGINSWQSDPFIYHNNFVNNTQQVFLSFWSSVYDDGYPSGGNYWSDYNGTDLYKGSNQNQSGSDGVGDTPYVVYSSVLDRYPLMTPWSPIPPNKLKVRDLVRATDNLNVRTGPGLSFSLADTMLRGNKGVVLAGPIGADGYNWWKISYDIGVTGWSADEWLELAPSRPQPPSDFTSWVDEAVNWAAQRMGNDSWAGYGLRFVADAFMQEEDKPAGWVSALAAAADYDHFDRLDQMLYGWREAPKGAVVFFDAEGGNPYGQVGIYLGNGSIIHVYGTVTTDSMEGAIGKPGIGQYLGWSYPPEAWRPTPAPNQPPVANAGQDRSVSSGELVAFDASASYDPDLDGTITGYRWNFGDGTTDEGKTVNHRFRGAQNGPKDYTVQLTVEDDHGATNSDSVLVTVNQLKKRVELSPTVLGSSYMETTYNWIGTDEATDEDLYIISRIDTCFGGIVGASQFFIVRKIDSSPSWKVVWHIPKPTEWAWNTASYTTPFTPSLWQELWGTPCKTSKHTFSDGTFEGINVTKNSFMLLVSSGAEIAIIMEYWDAGWAKFDPNSPATSLQLEQLQEFGEFSDVVDLLDNLIDVIFSPGELRLYDSQGRVTGLVNGVKKEEIPGSAYVNDTVIIFYPNETYRHEVVGLENGNYSLLSILTKNGTTTTFKASNIPISTSGIHQYVIDWIMLTEGREGVSISVDISGDKYFEFNFTADAELTQEEFLVAIPEFSPTVLTLLLIILSLSAMALEKRRFRRRFSKDLLTETR